MQNSKRPDLTGVIKDIYQAIEYSLANNVRCLIPHTIYSKWHMESLPLLEATGLIRKEKSKKAKGIRCTCENGELLEVEYKPDSQAFIQCFDCGKIRDVMPKELEYYESSPLHIAKFFTDCIDDIYKPKPIIKDKAFFVGETKDSVLVYFASGLESKNQKATLDKCSDDANGAAFIIISSFIPSTIAKKPIIVAAYDSKLYTVGDNSISLNIGFIESHFAKNSQKKEAAAIRWQNDPKKKVEDRLIRHLEINIANWNGLNHVDIANHISEYNASIISYKTKQNKQAQLNSKKVKSIIKQFFESRNETYRILGHKDYNSDTYVGW